MGRNGLIKRAKCVRVPLFFDQSHPSQILVVKTDKQLGRQASGGHRIKVRQQQREVRSRQSLQGNTERVLCANW
jgi:hypothetical protein